MKQEWCEHIKIRSGSKWYYGNFDSQEGGCSLLNNKYNFCPECGTPRPREMELWEKFEESYTGGMKRCLDRTDIWKQFVKIAELHFKCEI